MVPLFPVLWCATLWVSEHIGFLSLAWCYSPFLIVTQVYPKGYDKAITMTTKEPCTNEAKAPKGTRYRENAKNRPRPAGFPGRDMKILR